VPEPEIAEALPFSELLVLIDVSLVGDKLAELLIVGSVGTFDFVVDLGGHGLM
jgi:hypothetical protein